MNLTDHLNPDADFQPPSNPVNPTDGLDTTQSPGGSPDRPFNPDGTTGKGEPLVIPGNPGGGTGTPSSGPLSPPAAKDDTDSFSDKVARLEVRLNAIEHAGVRIEAQLVKILNELVG